MQTSLRLWGVLATMFYKHDDTKGKGRKKGREGEPEILINFQNIGNGEVWHISKGKAPKYLLFVVFYYSFQVAIFIRMDKHIRKQGR